MRECVFRRNLHVKETGRDYVICMYDRSRRNGCKPDCPHRKENRILDRIMRKVFGSFGKR